MIGKNLMPTYEYKCEACGHAFEKFQSIMASPVRKCPVCGKLKVRRLISMGAGVIFKGSGFYSTDYRSESYKSGEKTEAGVVSAAKGDDKKTPDTTATKTDAAAKPDAAAKNDSPAKSDSSSSSKSDAAKDSASGAKSGGSSSSSGSSSSGSSNSPGGSGGSSGSQSGGGKSESGSRKRSRGKD